jgi:3-deoxy-D-manno-octulosonic acid kinase
MQLKQLILGSRAIVYDANRIPQPGPELFEPGYWRDLEAVVGQAQGRGNALLLETPFGPAVLRHYQRGGMAAKLSCDRYFFSGFSRSRPVLEAGILASLHDRGLPVPEVLAALCERHGLVYSGALITARIADAHPLADRLARGGGNEALWTDIGCCLRRFHKAGVFHADLNARNILIDNSGKVWLVDFDRARFMRPDSRMLRQNLARLLRSLRKLGAVPEAELEEGWRSLKAGYQSVGLTG